MNDQDADATDRNASVDALATRTAEQNRVWRNSLDILIVSDTDGVFREVSPAWKQILGHNPSEVIGHSFRDFVLQDDVELTSRAVASAATGVDVNGFENRFRHKDGQCFFRFGMPLCVLLTSWAVDITQQFRAFSIAPFRGQSRPFAPLVVFAMVSPGYISRKSYATIPSEGLS